MFGQKWFRKTFFFKGGAQEIKQHSLAGKTGLQKPFFAAKQQKTPQRQAWAKKKN